MKIESFYFTFALNYYLLGIIFRYILSESNQIFSIRLLFCSTMHEVMRCYIPVPVVFLIAPLFNKVIYSMDGPSGIIYQS